MNIEPYTDPEINPADAIRILKTASCPSLSGKSKLTYNIGCNALGEIQFQVIANDGGGFWNDDWVAQQGILAVLNEQPQNITSSTLRSLYPSKSTNSPGFLLAVLKHLELVQPSTINPRCYELGSPKDIDALLATELATTAKTIAIKKGPKGKPIKP